MKNIYRKLKLWVLSFAGRLFSLLPIEQDKVVFDNFSGRGFGDNPKYITEMLRKKCDWVKIVWLSYEPAQNFPSYIKVVRYGSIRAMYELSTAKIWVDNVRGTIRPCKRLEQIYLQTWHSPGGVKKLEQEIENILPYSYVSLAKKDGSNCDAILTASRCQQEKMEKYFWLNAKVEFLKFGCPRNDLLLNAELQDSLGKKVREWFNLPEKSFVVLYMPTFRDDESLDGYLTSFDEILKAFEKMAGQDVYMLIRFHPKVPNLRSLVKYGKKILDATFYPDGQELYSVTNILISDYSSAPFDFSLLGKKIFLYVADEEKYLKRLSQIWANIPFPKSRSVSELISQIQTFKECDYSANVDKFKKLWGSYDVGRASALTADWMLNKMNRKNENGNEKI